MTPIDIGVTLFMGFAFWLVFDQTLRYIEKCAYWKGWLAGIDYERRRTEDPNKKGIGCEADAPGKTIWN